VFFMLSMAERSNREASLFLCLVLKAASGGSLHMNGRATPQGPGPFASSQPESAW
jgi:hypothetical protein